MARIFILLLAVAMLYGCHAYQPTKNVWKGTKSLWATYVSPPADVDYDDKGALSPQADLLTRAMVGVDNELARLEKVMQNADKPPTQEWMERLFANFPWLSGFAGVKYDGTILGQQPADSLKELDFNYLLHEDAKQKSRALRADVQPSPLGPEVLLAAPLYDGIDFLGIVVAYFDMRALMGYSNSPQDIVVLTPTALLWPGKYDFAATPLPGVDWEKVVRESSQGTCSNATGTFFYFVRYLANLPLVFAVPQKGDFPEGNGGIEQGFAFYPPQREKGAPPPVSEERLQKEELAKAEQAKREAEEAAAAQAAEAAAAQSAASSNDLQPGSRDSVLLRKRQRAARQVEERQLEGENVQVERVQRPRRRPAPIVIPDEALEPPMEMEQPVMERPSPFGPRESGAAQPAQPARPSPFGPASQGTASEGAATTSGAPNTDTAPKPAPRPQAAPEQTGTEPAATPESDVPAPNRLPGGRPSPFGPR